MDYAITMIPKIIDELNRRMEEAEDNDETEAAKVLRDFYDWFVENFIS